MSYVRSFQTLRCPYANWLWWKADVFWCLTKLIDGIQDLYTNFQPGIQRMVFKLKELVNRIDAKLYEHFQEHKVEFSMFAYRWMNCLLLREIPVPLLIRVWDTYLAEERGTEGGLLSFHLYLCGSLLMHWAPHLKKLDFQDLILFLQHLPTERWTERDIELVLAQAYVYKTLFHDSPHHLL